MWEFDPGVMGVVLVLGAASLLLAGLLVFLIQFDREQARKGAERQEGIIERRREVLRHRWEARRTHGKF